MPRVLIIDDEESQRPTLAIALRLDGFDVSHASTATEALRQLAAQAIDLAIIDVMMPGVNGLDLARQIRRHFSAVRVVLSCAYQLSARQVERADCGAVAFVSKPYRPAELSAVLRDRPVVAAASLC